MWDVTFWVAVFTLGFILCMGAGLYFVTLGEVDMNAKNMTDDDLAQALRAMVLTGICPSRQEKEFLEEAADRLERRDEDAGVDG